MTVLYRYLRPEKYSFSRREVQTVPDGGVCFRIQQNDDGTTLLSYSICHPNEVFSKDVARRIVDGRSEYGFGFYVSLPSMSLDAICEAVLLIADDWGTAAKDSQSAREFYQSADLGILANRIRQFRKTHHAVQSLTTLDHDVIDALDLKEKYANQNR